MRYASRCSQVSAALSKNALHISCCPVLIVCKGFDKKCDSAGTIAFVLKFYIFNTFKFSCTFLDSLVDVVFRHVGCFCLEDSSPKPCISFFVAAAHLGSYCNFLNDLCEDLTALCVCSTFFMLDTCPFAMTGHTVSLL